MCVQQAFSTLTVIWSGPGDVFPIPMTLRSTSSIEMLVFHGSVAASAGEGLPASTN